MAYEGGDLHRLQNQNRSETKANLFIKEDVKSDDLIALIWSKQILNWITMDWGRFGLTKRRKPLPLKSWRYWSVWSIWKQLDRAAHIDLTCLIWPVSMIIAPLTSSLNIQQWRCSFVRSDDDTLTKRSQLSGHHSMIYQPNKCVWRPSPLWERSKRNNAGILKSTQQLMTIDLIIRNGTVIRSVPGWLRLLFIIFIDDCGWNRTIVAKRLVWSTIDGKSSWT